MRPGASSNSRAVLFVSPSGPLISRTLPHAMLAAMRTLRPHALLDAFLADHRRCPLAVDDLDVRPAPVRVWCSCGAGITVRLPPGPGGP
jgi:hypothetical protein